MLIHLVHAKSLGAHSVTSRRVRCLNTATVVHDSLLPYVALATGDSAAEIHLFGGCVTSYSKGGVELLAHRRDSKLDGATPISGGIPFCFPQFGAGALQQHGFARNLVWELASTVCGEEPSVVLRLCESDYTLAMWPHAFECTYTVTLKPDRLATAFRWRTWSWLDGGPAFVARAHTLPEVPLVEHLRPPNAPCGGRTWRGRASPCPSA